MRVAPAARELPCTPPCALVVKTGLCTLWPIRLHRAIDYMVLYMKKGPLPGMTALEVLLPGSAWQEGEKHLEVLKAC